MTGSVSGNGSVTIGPDAAFSVSGAMSANGITFLTSGGHETLVLGTPTAASSLIHGFRPTDRIDLVGFVANGLNFQGGVLTVTRAGGGSALLRFGSAYSTGHFAFASDGHGGTNIMRT